ncbi:leucine-rich repeat protein [uncultured Ruminococcus sp.]|uniref:leucine-rich repeat protein n=1 Tax=uncultured Ruminococcus sp. TaxID=165186 RepID=UPI0025CC63AB|nr:leucine-rich repeat protein [uncultured Ruminococcus sp.]
MECGFFNSKGEDRLYNAEHFTSYLSSMICNGIQDTVGECFASSVSEEDGLLLTIGSGKAWINGHYAQMATSEKLDLTAYVDESLSRCVAVGIYCDTSDTVRDCGIEVLPGTCAGSPQPPKFTNTKSRIYLTICTVRLRAGATSILSGDVTDCRDDATLCGYCKCILGKCGVTALQEQMAALESRMGALEKKMDALEVEVLDSGTCGENASYTRYTNGLLHISGSGALDDQDETSIWDKAGVADGITRIIVDDGITKIGKNFFRCLSNVTSVLIGQTVSDIGMRAFAGCSKISGITLPLALTELAAGTFSDTGIKALLVPVSVVRVCVNAFIDMSIDKLIYAGTKAQWAAVDKQSYDTTPSLADSWDVTGTSPDTFLQKVICSDGTYVRDTSGNWTVE